MEVLSRFREGDKYEKSYIQSGSKTGELFRRILHRYIGFDSSRNNRSGRPERRNGEIDYIGSYVWCTESWYQGMHSEIFIFLLPVACTLPASASYLEDLQNGISMYIMPRTSRKRYGFSKVVNCGLYGGLAAACSLLLLLVVNVIRYPLNNMQFMQWKNMGMSYHMALLENILILCLNGMLYALTGGLVGAITKNRYMAYAAPFIFYYVVFYV